MPSSTALLPFEARTGFTIAGSTGSGKTVFTYKLLKNHEAMFKAKALKSILYCYSVYQPLFSEMENALPQIRFHPGIPDEKSLSELAPAPDDKDHHSILILDDLAPQVVKSPAMEKLFTVDNHHKGITTLFLVQNLYQQGPCARSIALNSQYIVLLKNVRAGPQIKCLGRQLFPEKSRLLSEAYGDAMKEAYAYLIVDLFPHSDSQYRIRTHIFPGEDVLVYQALS